MKATFQTQATESKANLFLETPSQTHSEVMFDQLSGPSSQVVLVVKNLPANAGDIREWGSIPGSERSPLEKGMATHSSILSWEIPWTEEPDGLQSIVLQSQT